MLESSRLILYGFSTWAAAAAAAAFFNLLFFSDAFALNNLDEVIIVD